MEMKMKRSYWLRLICSGLIALILIAPLSTVSASGTNNPIPAPETVTASAVIVPAHVAELGFSISAIAREIPVKEGDTIKAGQTLIVLDTPNLQFAVTEAQAALRLAQAQADIQSNDIRKQYKINWTKFTVKKLRLSVPHEVIEIADAKVQRAQASVEIAQANLAQGTLVAPFDGVVASINVVTGEFVKPDQAVITIAALNSLQVETIDLGERDIPNIHIGDPANVIVEALNKTIPGKVI